MTATIRIDGADYRLNATGRRTAEEHLHRSISWLDHYWKQRRLFQTNPPYDVAGTRWSKAAMIETLGMEVKDCLRRVRDYRKALATWPAAKASRRGRCGLNHITVIAHGSPDSFVRRVQEDPAVAVDLLAACEAALPYLEAYVRAGALPAGEDDSHYGDRQAIEKLRSAIACAKQQPRREA